MPWQDCHLHEFEIDEDRFEARDESDDSWDPNDGRKDEKRFTLGELVKKGSQFTYTYDFGDGWRHLVTVEKIGKPTGGPDLDFPACVAGTRAWPPEDCGGPYSYEEFLDALSDKHHPEHRDTKQWAGAFEPEVFSVQQANAAVGAMFVWAKNSTIESEPNAVLLRLLQHRRLQGAAIFRSRPQRNSKRNNASGTAIGN